MLSLWPAKRIATSAAPACRWALHVLVVGALAAVFVPLAAWAVPPASTQAASPKTELPAGIVGQEVCATCHEDVAKKFGDNPHTRMAQLHGNSGVTCESCHGPGQAHMEGGGDVTKIINPSKLLATKARQTCLGCHADTHPDFPASAHAKSDVGCLGCHDIHSSKEDSLLKATQPKLCYQCHTDVKPQFSMPFHHKVNEGVVQCKDCHDPHGTPQQKALNRSPKMDMVCTKCHTEAAGPFVYEHAPVKAEGCTACHVPHGGPNPRLLSRATVNGLCLECHTPSANFSTETPGHNQNGASYNSCTLCHTAIHGSNYNKRFASAF